MRFDWVLSSVASVLSSVVGIYLAKRILFPARDLSSCYKRIQDLERQRGRALTELKLNEHECEISKDIVTPEDITVDFSSIGALEDIKESIQEVLFLQINRPDLFKDYKSKLLRPPKGILLYGPPGTGKTMMAKAIAKEGQLAFINVNQATLLNKLWGESEKLVQAIFTLAHKLQPCVVFFDEIDCFFQGGQDKLNPHYLSLESLFITLWDGLLTNPSSCVVVIGATNRPHCLSPALLRRLPLQFHFGLPNARQREKILQVVLKDEPLAPHFQIKELALLTEDYSGSDLEELCKKAALEPLREFIGNEKDRTQIGASLRPMELKDFCKAMKEVAPTGRKAQEYHQNLSPNRHSSGSGASDLRFNPLQLLLAMMGNAEQNASLGSSHEHNDDDVHEASEKNDEDERIAKWSKRFEGENGAKLLEQLCALMNVDISQPRPVVIRELATVFM